LIYLRNEGACGRGRSLFEKSSAKTFPDASRLSPWRSLRPFAYSHVESSVVILVFPLASEGKKIAQDIKREKENSFSFSLLMSWAERESPKGDSLSPK
jgi:hypothetical protein